MRLRSNRRVELGRAPGQEHSDGQPGLSGSAATRSRLGLWGSEIGIWVVTAPVVGAQRWLGSCWDADPFAYQLTLSCSARWPPSRNATSKDAEVLVLRHENAVLRRHMEKAHY